jgi:hypothetical protein
MPYNVLKGVEWNAARGDIAKLDFDRVDQDDPRIINNAWHNPDIEMRACTPTPETEIEVAKIIGK